MLKGNIKAQLFYAAALTLVAAAPLCGQPLVPINTAFSHWDHHWIMWTPQHPVYEAVEVMSADNPQSPNGKLVRVFFTERAGGKKQVYYFNDAAVAKRWRVGEVYHRDIEYRAEGEPGKPLNLVIKFNDKDERRAELTLEFDKEQRLTNEYAGLSDQVGHGAESVFLLFFREKTAVAARSRLLIGGEDYSIKRDQPGGTQSFYRTGYRSNIYVATVSYGETRFDWKQDVLTSSRGRVFKRLSDVDGGTVYRSAPAQDQTVIELLTNSEGEMREYRHLLEGHTVRIEFEAALPSIKSAKSGQTVRYRISIDDFRNLVEGIVSVKKEGNVITLEWQHQSPNWTKNYYLLSTVRPTADGGYDLIVARKK